MTTFIESLVIKHCCSCGCAFGITIDMDSRRRTDGKSFHCPNGHSQAYTETEVARLQREVARATAEADQARADARWQRERKEAMERQRNAARGQITKLKKRVGRGVCPCCNRTFQNLQRHMAGKHPEFLTPDPA